MTSLLDLMLEAVDDLQVAGVRATSDPRNANPPCVLVRPPSFVADVSCGGTATLQALCITRGPGNADAWRSIDDLAGQVSKVIAIEQIEPAEFQPDNGAPLPAYLLTWTKAISWP